MISKLANVIMWGWHHLELPLQGADGFDFYLPEALLRVEIICPFGAMYAWGGAFGVK